MTFQQIQVEPLMPTIGATVTGVDLNRSLLRDKIGKISRSIHLLFRDIEPMTVNIAPDLTASRPRFSVAPPALLGGRCSACGTTRFPWRDICPACQSREVAEVPLPVTGTIYTFTIVRNKPPGYLGEVPYAFGFVDLDIGLRVISTLVADDLEALAIGDRVEFDLLMVGSGPEAEASYCYRKKVGA